MILLNMGSEEAGMRYKGSLMEIRLIPIKMSYEVRKGDNIARLIVDHADRMNIRFEDGDILVPANPAFTLRAARRR